MNINYNIALIGMPGCGKSTIGKILNEKLSVKLIDLDEYITEIEENSIDELFAKGESVFRIAESNALKKVLEIEESIIVSTGGGIVKSFENIDILRKNFIVIFIDRPVDNIYEDIDDQSRPLLKNNKNALIDLYDERYNLYKNACHIHVENKDEIDKVVNDIIDKIKSHGAIDNL